MMGERERERERVSELTREKNRHGNGYLWGRDMPPPPSPFTNLPCNNQE